MKAQKANITFYAFIINTFNSLYMSIFEIQSSNTRKKEKNKKNSEL